MSLTDRPSPPARKKLPSRPEQMQLSWYTEAQVWSCFLWNLPDGVSSNVSTSFGRGGRRPCTLSRLFLIWKMRREPVVPRHGRKAPLCLTSRGAWCPAAALEPPLNRGWVLWVICKAAEITDVMQVFREFPPLEQHIFSGVCVPPTSQFSFDPNSESYSIRASASSESSLQIPEQVLGLSPHVPGSWTCVTLET
jgi:hypothetical protein